MTLPLKGSSDVVGEGEGVLGMVELVLAVL
jgi:hypothetical protein